MIKISTNLQNLINRLLIWRLHNVSDKYFIIFLSVTIGILAGLATVIIKNTVHFISYLLTSDFLAEFKSFLFLVYPMFGMLMIIILLRFIIRKKARAEIPNVLFAISKLDGKMSPSSFEIANKTLGISALAFFLIINRSKIIIINIPNIG